MRKVQHFGWSTGIIESKWVNRVGLSTILKMWRVKGIKENPLQSGTVSELFLKSRYRNTEPISLMILKEF